VHPPGRDGPCASTWSPQRATGAKFNELCVGHVGGDKAATRAQKGRALKQDLDRPDQQHWQQGTQ